MDGAPPTLRRRFDAVVETVSMPPGVAATLRAAGYGVRGPAGVGAGGPVWTAVGPPGDDGRPRRVVVHALTVPPGEAGTLVAQRLEALGSLDHPHLAQVVDVLPLPPSGPARSDDAPGSAVAVLVAEVAGATLAALLAARGPLSPGEVVALTVPLAGALDTLHAAGLVHGDVSPGNIVVRPDGCPVLIDLLGAVQPGPDRGARRGTPGYVAPEVTAAPRTVATGPTRGPGPRGGGRPGEVPGEVPEGAPADVYGLAAVALAVLDPAEVDGPLGQELVAARVPDPVRRPTAGELAAGCFARAAPVPIALPDAGVLARTALAQLAGEGRTVSLDRRSRHRAPVRRRTRARRTLGATGVAGAVVAVVGVAVGALGPSPGAGVDAPTAGGRPGEVVAAGPPHPDAVRAAVELTHHRVDVLTGGDVGALADVVREGSSAHAADVALLEGLGAAGARLEGLTATGVTAHAVPGDARAVGGTATPQDAAPGRRVDVAVTSGLSAHRRVTPEGAVEVPAQPPRTVVLALVWTADGWRVDSVREP